MASGTLLQRIMTAGMCCLTVLGAAPRLDCLCPSSACQIACETLGQAESCCQHEPEAPATNGSPAINETGCQCDLQVVQDQVSPVVRNDGQLGQPQVLWLDANDISLALSRPELRTDCSFFTSLPPDDPVTRAQILRL